MGFLLDALSNMDAQSAQRLLRQRYILTLVCVVTAFAYLAFVCVPGQVESTRISEHALLAGIVQEGFDRGHQVRRFVGELDAFHGSRNLTRQLLRDNFKANEIDVFEQNFYSKITGKPGTNIFGVVRAVRAVPEEAILVVVQNAQKQNRAIATILAFAIYAKSKSFWARDLIFLFVDGRDPFVATQAFLAAYNGDDLAYLRFDPLETNSGFLIAGLCLDVQQETFSHLHIQYISLNGLLPNLDVVNTAVRMSRKVQIPSTVRPQEIEIRDQRRRHIETLYRNIFAQAFDELEGVHALLNQYGVHAVTVRTHRAPKPTNQQQQQHHHHHHKQQQNGLERLARLVEGQLRAYNNVLERFHQSYFFYLLPSPDHFLSIAFFAPAAALLLLPLLVHQFAAWCECAELARPTEWLAVHLLCTLLYSVSCGLYADNAAIQGAIRALLAHLDHPERDLAVLFVAVAYLLPVVAVRPIKSPNEHATTRFLHFTWLLAAFLCLGLQNFSLALFWLTYVSVALVGQKLFPVSNILTRTVYALLFSPITFYGLTLALAVKYDFWPRKVSPEIFGDDGRPLPANLLMAMLAEARRHLLAHLQYGSAFFPLFALLVQPTHLLFTALVGGPQRPNAAHQKTD